MPFTNRIRLPFEIVKPQFPEVKNVYKKANGEIKVLSVVVSKTYEGRTDWFPENWHERLKMALAHDNVTIEGDKYLGGVSQDGEYLIEWTEFLDYPTAPAKFKIQVTPFAATNSNCQTCEVANQLNLEDDYFNDSYGDPIPLQEGEEYSIDVKENDTIHCYPSVFSIVTYNPTYVVSVAIDANGIIYLRIGEGLQAQNNIALVTYRVTCPDGSYDEATVYGDVDGSIITCLSPTNIEGNATSDSIPLTWDAPSPAPAVGYNWQIEEDAAPGVIIQFGSTTDTFVTITGLTPNTLYTFSVQSDCGATQSPFVISVFSTAPASSACGTYDLLYTPASGESNQFASVSYIDCNAVYQNTILYPNITRGICALQTAGEGIPNFIEGATTINYTGLC